MNEEEKTFLNTDAAKVTSARVVIGNQTFAMAGITSVEVSKDSPRKTFLFGTLATLTGIGMLSEFAVFGGLLMVAGAFLLWAEARKPTLYHLIIRAAGGEINALTSTNATSVEVIAAAITDAMVYRG